MALIDSMKLEQKLDDLTAAQNIPFITVRLEVVKGLVMSGELNAKGCHCKECTAWERPFNRLTEAKKTGRCTKHHVYMDEDDFCSKGERKEA